MGEASGEKKGIAELLEKIPPEKRWAITAKVLTGLYVMRGTKIMPTALDKEEGILAPVWGWEKILEINNKIMGRGGRKLFSMVKETFNISVDDVVGAAKLVNVAVTLLQGPEYTAEIVEARPERAVIRVTKCAWWERYKEFEMDPELVICDKGGDQAFVGEGLNAVNPKITYKLMKALPRGDPYCEGIYEFKEV
jgi:hypothetical protein